MKLFTHHLSLITILVLAATAAQAQQLPTRSQRTTVYEQYKPAIITLESGKTLTHQRANVFLKNGALLYKSGGRNMEADMSTVRKAQFDDKTYVRIDSMLAYVVDTVGANKLYCATLIDIEAYKTMLLNNQQLTNLQITSFVNVTAMDAAPEQVGYYPLIRHFYFEIDGKMIKAHERNLKRAAPKDKQRMIKTIMQQPGFSWDNPKSLLALLKAVS